MKFDRSDKLLALPSCTLLFVAMFVSDTAGRVVASIAYALMLAWCVLTFRWSRRTQREMEQISATFQQTNNKEK